MIQKLDLESGKFASKFYPSLEDLNSKVIMQISFGGYRGKLKEPIKLLSKLHKVPVKVAFQDQLHNSLSSLDN